MKEAESTQCHKAAAPKTIGFAIVVISTTVHAGTREDRSGEMLKRMVIDGGHLVHWMTVVPDDPAAIRGAIEECLKNPSIRAIVTTGGTGLTLTDVTYETVRGLFSKEITGFNALFMQLSFDDVGPACMLSRATAGIIRNAAALFALPGSPKACELAMKRLILPEVAHMAKHFGEA